jgi:NAD(P)-dependent dehydrogenase (short-subunit alcohol dehydrogenase family)
VRGPLLQLGALAPLVVDGGAVLINTSVVHDLGMPGSAVYSATKGAVRSIMAVMSNELGPRGIRVNAISPGPTAVGHQLMGPCSSGWHS